jgi:proteasome chaperone 2
MIDLSKEILSKLDSKKLIIPSISVGNVPQLTTDLILHNFDFKWVSSLDVTYLYPFASPVDYTDSRPPKGQVCTALELYVDDVNGLALIQQRSPILPGFGKNFLDYMTQLIQSVKFSQIVILDSNDCTLRSNLDRQSPIDVYSNDLSEQFKKFQIQEQENEELSFSPYVKALINSIKDFTIVLALVMFVYEGDNLFDSQVFATRVVELLKLMTPSWKKPKSWEALYGDRPLPLGLEEGIYG